MKMEDQQQKNSFSVDVPEITIADVKGLSTQEVTKLKQSLDDLAKGNEGREMILSLALFTQDFLYEHQKRPTGSFYDEMLKRNQLQEQKTKKLENEFQEQEVLGIKYEIERKMELLKEEVRNRKDELKTYGDMRTESQGTLFRLGTSPSKEFSRDLIETSLKSNLRRSFSQRRGSGDETQPDTPCVITVELTIGKSTQTFQRGEILGGNSFGYNVYAAIETHTGKLVVISEWNLDFVSLKKKTEDFSSSEAQEDFLRQVNCMESEVKLFQKLQHVNIVSYIGMTVMKTFSRVTVYSVQEFIRGMSLKSYLQGTLTMDIPLIRHCTLGIANALAFLHANNIVHRFLRETSVFISTEGVIKLGDYAVERKLGELLRSVNGNQLIPDQYAPSIGRGAKKGDVYRVGILVLSLLNGQKVTQNPPHFPSALPPEILDFLNR